MKANKIIALIAGAIAFIACDPTPGPTFEPALSVDKTGTISVTGEGADTLVNVTANISWTAVADQDFVTVTPASLQITDKTSNTTPVTISVAENEGDARTANITITAEGCEPVVITIEQGEVVIPAVFEVLDGEGNAITDAYDFKFAKDSVIVYANANVAWTATPSAAWITAKPASFIPVSQVAEPIAVTIVADANTTDDARDGSVTFSAEGQEDIVISFNQPVAPTLAISVANVTYQSADVTYTSSSKTEIYYYVLLAKSTYDSAVKAGLSDSDIVKYFLHQNAQTNKVTDEYYLSVLGVTETYTQAYSGLPESTELIALACFFDAAANPITDAASATFTTEAKPGADPSYLANLGVYTFNCYDYFEDDAPVSNAVMEITEDVVNESYKFCIYDIFGPDYSAQYGAEYVDRFTCAWNKSDNTIILPNDAIGDFGCYWGFTFTDEYCGIALSMGFNVSESNLTALVLTPDKSGNLIGSTMPALEDGDSIWMQATIYTLNPQTGKIVDSGYAAACLDFNDGVTFTKQVAPAVKNAVQHSIFEMPRMLKSKQFKANKASIAR